MKLRDKSLIVIGVTWLFYAAILSTFYPLTLANLILTTSIFAAITMLALYKYVILNIEKFVLKLKSREPLPSQQINDISSTETKIISCEINKFLQNLENIQTELEQQLEERTSALTKRNIQLQQEISDRISIERKMAINRETITQLAHYDNLTSLPNSIFFNEILNKAMKHAKRHNKILAILFIDISDLKSINEKLGHAGGDFVLKEIGSRLKNSLRDEDILARLNGDEFIILLNDIGKAKFASAVAEKILTACNHPLRIESNEIVISAHVGICIYPDDGHSLEKLLKNAEQALAQAKQKGNNIYCFYSQKIDEEATEFIKLKSALRDAIKNNELMLYYQPKLNIRLGHVSGVEALIRWLHPEYGFVPTSRLISVAEETGLINEIGAWALYEACKANKQWQSEGYEHVTIAVNLSSKQFYNPEITTQVTAILDRTKLNPRYLELEINETTVMGDSEKSAGILQQLKSTGVILSIDHFGTGYTSISQLKQFPINLLKIDHTFIKGIPQNPDDCAVVNAFIGLAHNLGIEVTAEGVETADQVQYLAIQNCDIVQGYFLSHPIPAQKIISQFKKLQDEVLL